jgi:hypothetical protein
MKNSEGSNSFSQNQEENKMRIDDDDDDFNGKVTPLTSRLS